MKVTQFLRNPWWILVMLFLAALGVRTFQEGSGAWNRGMKALQDGDAREAVFQFRTSARWTLPGWGLPGESLQEIGKIANSALERCRECPESCNSDPTSDCSHAGCEDCALAVYAFDSGRSAIMSSRSFYSPHGDSLEAFNEGLSQSLVRAAETYPPGPRQPRSTREVRLEEHRRQMKTDHIPPPLPGFGAAFGFIAWLGGLGLHFWFAARSSARNENPGKRWLMVSFVGFVVWVVSSLSL